ncbi:hypothetical protein [Streptomyces sp. ISL-36]|uniref:hypothetical protein n=1 Tax=Streptomyces sp. ISL-36 TaxID=2819182 RepID=UPI0027E41591|nr:hypothetical protein [Streptomyces sp. ISL-36]
MTTHDAGNRLTQADFDLARRNDAIVAAHQALPLDWPLVRAKPSHPPGGPTAAEGPSMPMCLRAGPGGSMTVSLLGP